MLFHVTLDMVVCINDATSAFFIPGLELLTVHIYRLLQSIGYKAKKCGVT